MDFFRVVERRRKEQGQEVITVRPEFLVGKHRDLMIRGGSFYAVWDQDRELWSDSEYDVASLIDRELFEYRDRMAIDPAIKVRVASLKGFDSRSWQDYKTWTRSLPDHFEPLNTKLKWSNQEVTREDYITRQLDYPLEEASCEAYDEMMSVLYAKPERDKIEWSIGAIIAGDSVELQKFLVLFGASGTGKSTVLEIVEMLFEGHIQPFDARALGTASSQFALEAFRSNPIVAIQHDGDLSRIEDNTRLNSIIGHDRMLMNEKGKSQYWFKPISFLMVGSNSPVKITDAKSGILRRLIDVSPTGELLDIDRYFQLKARLPFELSGIAWRCLQVYKSLGKHYYQAYRPVAMMRRTNDLFGFVNDSLLELDGCPHITLTRAYALYKEYVEDAGLKFLMPRRVFAEELKEYFQDFKERAAVDGVKLRNVYFLLDHAKLEPQEVKNSPGPKIKPIVLNATESLLDKMLADRPAQYDNGAGAPKEPWSRVSTTLGDIDTSQVHYVRVPKNHIVIDFDIKNADGEKDPSANLTAAAEWPPTYAEFSKSGGGVHLHYIYEGDLEHLAKDYAPGIEVKVFRGKSALRRRVSYCNDLPVAILHGGLPRKEAPVIDHNTMMSERGLRDLIERNLRKEIHPGTKPSVDFIRKILDDAYKSGMEYDVSDMEPRVILFASRSSNQAGLCMKLCQEMKFKSEHDEPVRPVPEDTRKVYFDCEVFPNLFVLCWKPKGGQTVGMINPSPEEIEPLLKTRLVGFNCRKYDNHITYGAYMGLNNAQLYQLSKRVIDNAPGATFREAYNLSYADIYDFAATKKSLKKWEIDLGIHHQELGFDWDQPVPEDKWHLVVEYCKNDVEATEAVDEHLSADFTARQLLAELAEMTPNDTTQRLAAKIIFEGNPAPQSEFVYTDLSEMFPGYKYEFGKSTYRGEETGEGGLVRATPGIYRNVKVFDVESMHPTSIEQLNLFGKYTKNFSDLKAARVAIKHGDYDKVRHMFGGKLAPYLKDESSAKDLSYALKIVINSVYGLSSAKFNNPFRDPRNVDNIVAKRGALFMIDLWKALEDHGVHVFHIKTDSIKIENPSPETEEFIHDFGKKYGYKFDVEDEYDRLCLVNDAVYVARDYEGRWHATGAQFAEPYVFKRLFSKEPITFEDCCTQRSVTTALYLDMGTDGASDYKFIGKTGQFTPVTTGGGTLLRIKDDKYYAVSGTKGHKWVESETIPADDRASLTNVERNVFEELVGKARAQIEKFGDAEAFLND